MGLIFTDEPLSWQDMEKVTGQARKLSISRFLDEWTRFKDRDGDPFLWGDELEYMVISLDHQSKNAKLSLRQHETLNSIQSETAEGSSTPQPSFQPEYGSYMLESSPARPYTGSVSDLLSVESNMRSRRALARRHLKPNESILTVTSFPRLGAPGVFTEPHHDVKEDSHSAFLPDEIINPNPRYSALTANIHTRRGPNKAITVPIHFDRNTPRPFIDPTIPWDKIAQTDISGPALHDHIYMDAVGFGSGCCCLQITLQGRNLAEARRLHDGLVPIAPIMLALTAASPIFRGYLSDVDCRWHVIAQGADDRTEEERGVKQAKNGGIHIPKSRFDSVDMYISQDASNFPEYNDLPCPYNEEICAQFQEHGVDELLSKHIAHLMIRDPLILFPDSIHADAAPSSDTFENLQSTVWPTVRFKLPSNDGSCGWRIEFRSMEVQLTDFENAAHSVFLVLLSRAILHFGLNFYIPISKVDENMGRAQKRGAVLNETFYFRNPVWPMTCGREPELSDVTKAPVESELCEMTLSEIVNGKKDTPGLLGFVWEYTESLELQESERAQLKVYLDLVKRRAEGSLMTTAAWIRQFIKLHPDYKFNSVVTQEINYGLMCALDEIDRGVRDAHDLLPAI